MAKYQEGNKNPTPFDALKKMYDAQSIEKKDKGVKDLFIGDQKEVTIDIVGIMSKVVAKYAKADDPDSGHYTMLYLKDGTKIGAFSGGLYRFAKFLYRAAGLSEGEFSRIYLEGDSHIKLKITKVPLDGGKSTYNFEMVSGDITNVTRLGGTADTGTLLIESGDSEDIE